MSFFTLDAADDDQWVDVKSKEEVLQTELDKAKEHLQNRQYKLQQTSLEVDLLKGHKTNLETERESLQFELKKKEHDLSRAGKELEDVSQGKEFLKKEFVKMKASMDGERNKLSKSLASCKNELEDAQAEIARLKIELEASKVQRENETREAGDAIRGLRGMVKSTEDKLSTLDNESKKVQLALGHAQREMKEHRLREFQLRSEISKEKTALAKKTKKLEETLKELGTVALFAEELKGKKQALEHSLRSSERELDATRNHLKQSRSREAAMKTEISDLKKRSDARISDLQESLASQNDSLDDRKDRIEHLQAVLDGFNTQHDGMEDSLREAQSSLDRERTLNAELTTKVTQLEVELKNKETKFAEDLERANAQPSNREVALQSELRRQILADEQRLSRVDAILNESFLLVIRRSADVPFLALLRALPALQHSYDKIKWATESDP